MIFQVAHDLLTKANIEKVRFWICFSMLKCFLLYNGIADQAVYQKSARPLMSSPTFPRPKQLSSIVFLDVPRIFPLILAQFFSSQPFLHAVLIQISLPFHPFCRSICDFVLR